MRLDTTSGEFVLNDMRDDYVALVKHVRKHGRLVSPRGEDTVELRNVSLRLDNPRDSLPVGVGRKLNLSVAAYEAASLIAGVAYPEVIKRIQPRFQSFFDGGELHGAYGPRIRNSMPQVIKRLREDRDTRQAQVAIWNNERDLFGPSRDLPCTSLFRFYIRHKRLELDVTMRSNDIWLGFAYDLYMFTQAQLTVAHILDLPAGPYRHHASSLHLYTRDYPAANGLHEFEESNVRTPDGLRGEDWDSVAHVARELFKSDFKPLTKSEAWYFRHLEKFLD